MNGDYFYCCGMKDDADELVKKYHYSRRPPGNVSLVSTLHVPGGLFGDFGDVVAACYFSIPPTRWSEQVLELSRLVRIDDLKFSLSSLISFSLKRIRKLKLTDLVVSFADNGENHHGGIYQASSWNYAGLRSKRMDGLLVDGVFIPGRSCNSKYGSRSPEIVTKKLGREVLPHYDEGKHLYWKPINKSGKRKAARLGLKSMPYPKPGNLDKSNSLDNPPPSA